MPRVSRFVKSIVYAVGVLLFIAASLYLFAQADTSSLHELETASIANLLTYVALFDGLAFALAMMVSTVGSCAHDDRADLHGFAELLKNLVGSHHQRNPQR